MPRRIAANQKAWRRTPRVESFKHVNYTRIENPHKTRKKIFVFYYVAVICSLILLRGKNRYVLV